MLAPLCRLRHSSPLRGGDLGVGQTCKRGASPRATTVGSARTLKFRIFVRRFYSGQVEVAGVERGEAILTEEAPQSSETDGAGFRDRGNPRPRNIPENRSVPRSRGGGGSRTRVQTGNPKAFYTLSRRFVLLPGSGRRRPNPGPSSLSFAHRPERSGALSPN